MSGRQACRDSPQYLYFNEVSSLRVHPLASLFLYFYQIELLRIRNPAMDID